MTATGETTTRSRPDARRRILDSAYELFSRRGIRAVGVDELIDRAGVAKATFYNQFPSKDDLVLAFLQQREKLWTKDWVEAEARRRGDTPEGRLLAIFDLFDEWFQQDDFEGCSFVNVLLEFGGGISASTRPGVGSAPREHPLGRSFARGGGRPVRPRVVRPVVAHPDEGLDRPGR